MAALAPGARLAYRPLSSRCQCRFASDAAAPAKTRSGPGSLTRAILQTMDKKSGRPASSPRARGAIETLISNRQSNQVRAPSRLIDVAERNAQARAAAQEEQQIRPFTREDLERQQSRPWRNGDVYAPHDLSGAEMAKWKKSAPVVYPNSRRKDVFDHLGINPLKEYKNIALLTDFLHETGRIKHRRDTGLRPRNQRRLAKAVKRAVGIGLMPRTHHHPELIKRREIYAKR